jgi:hypothetical protein
MNRLYFRTYFLCLIGHLFIFSSLTSTAAIAAETSYPKFLSTKEIQAHFMQFKNIQTDQERREFSFTIDGNEIQRICPDCKYEHDVGLVTYKNLNKQICIAFEVVTFPDSGCYTLVQTGELKYEMRKLKQGAIFHYQVASKAQAAEIVLAPGWIPTSVFGRSILIDLSKFNPKPETLQTAINAALKGRSWQKENYSNAKTTFAKIKRTPYAYKVMIEYRKPWLAIGFVKGFQPRGDVWLNNLKRDILHYLGAR